MELRKYFITVYFILTTYCSMGQSISIEPAMNNLSNGVGLLYNHSLGKGWQASIGTRYQINIFSVNDNIKGHAYFQNGFATSIPEHFGILARASKRIYTKKKFSLDGFCNLLVSHTSLKLKFYHGRHRPITPSHPEVDIFLMEPSWAYEFTIGPKINYDISKRMALHAMAGYGILIDFYNDKGISLVTGIPVLYEPSSGWNRKWEYEMVGFEFLPMLYLGCTYELRK